MRVVIYDEELEPITVINLPGLTARDIERHGRHWRIPIPEMLSSMSFRPDAEPEKMSTMRIATLKFEPIRRGEVESYLCITKDAEMLMEVDPTWLPGQRRAHNRLVQENQMLSRIIGRILSGGY